MEELRDQCLAIHSEVVPVERQTIVDTSKEDRVTEPYFTKYEYTSLVGSRAQQLADGARPLISLEGILTSDPAFVFNVAQREVEEGVLPFIIHRRLPAVEGQPPKSEFWSVSELKIRW